MSDWARFAAKPGNLERRNAKRRARHDSQQNSAKCREWYQLNKERHKAAVTQRYREVGREQQLRRREHYRRLADKDDAARCELLAYGEFV